MVAAHPPVNSLFLFFFFCNNASLSNSRRHTGSNVTSVACFYRYLDVANTPGQSGMCDRNKRYTLSDVDGNHDNDNISEI